MFSVLKKDHHAPLFYIERGAFFSYERIKNGKIFKANSKKQEETGKQAYFTAENVAKSTIIIYNFEQNDKNVYG